MTSPPELYRPPDRRLKALRIVAILLAILGVFPLAGVMKWSTVLPWLPQSACEWATTLPITVAMCLVIAHWLGDRSDALIDRARAALLAPSTRDFAAWAALFVLALSLFLGWYCFGLRPIDTDEVSQRFQANILLHGRFSAVAEQYQQVFDGTQTLRLDGRWFSQFPVGGPLLLAIGAAVRLVWLVNPLLATWTAWNFYRFSSQITDELTARGATVLFAFSPMVLLMSGSEMNHVGALAFMMFALAALPEWSASQDDGRLRRLASFIGLGVAITATIRPYDAGLMAVVIGVYQLTVARRSTTHLRSLGWQFAAGAIPVTLLLIANWRTTGSPFTFGYEALNGAGHRPGFHSDPTGIVFTPIVGLHHISTYLLRLNAALLPGPVPSVVVIVLALALTKRATSWDMMLIGIIGAILVGYFAYWSESLLFGPRFLYMAIPAFVLFAARMPGALASRLTNPTWRRAALFLLPASLAVGWLLPTGSVTYIGVWPLASQLRTKYPSWSGEIGKRLATAGLTDAVVFVHESWHRRLAARLRAIGTPSLQAEQMVNVLDACVLQFALDDAEAQGGPPSIKRTQRVALRAIAAGEAKPLGWLAHQQDISLVPGRRLVPECVKELESDRDGVTPFDQFLTYAEFEPDGRLGGRVVFARDFGLKNARLLSAFGDRTWYRYRLPTGPNDGGSVFVPYATR